jgi:hypothetical protein
MYRVRLGSIFNVFFIASVILLYDKICPYSKFFCETLHDLNFTLMINIYRKIFVRRAAPHTDIGSSLGGGHIPVLISIFYKSAKIVILNTKMSSLIFSPLNLMRKLI